MQRLAPVSSHGDNRAVDLSGENAYLFRHALLRDAAYQLHLPSVRARLHGLVVELHSDLAREDLEPLALELANHAHAASQAGSAAEIQNWNQREAELLEIAVGHFESRFRHAERAAALVRLDELRIGPPKLRRLLEAGHSYFVAGETTLALRTLTHLLARLQESGDTRLHSDCLRLLGEVRGQQGDHEAAMELLRRAVDCAPAGDAVNERCRALTELGFYLHRIGRDGAALEALGEAERLARASGDMDLVGKVFSNMGMIHADGGQIPQAQAYLEQAHDLARSIGRKERLASTYSHLANIYSWTNDVERWRHCSEQALKLNGETGNQRGQMVCIGNRGIVMHEAGDLEGALQAYSEAERLAREMGIPYSIAVNLTNQGNVLTHMGRHEEALRKTDEAIAVARKLGLKPLMAMTWYHRGCVLGDAGRAAEARAALLESIALFESLPGSNYHAYALQELSCNYFSCSEYQEGVAAAFRGAELAEAAGDRTQAARCKVMAAPSLKMLGRAGEAAEFCRQALPLLEKVSEKRPFSLLRARTLLLEHALNEGDSEDAAAHATALRPLVLLSGLAGTPELEHARAALASFDNRR